MRKFSSHASSQVSVLSAHLIRFFTCLCVVVFLFCNTAFTQTEPPIQWVKVSRRGPNEITIKWTRYPGMAFKRYRLIRDDGRVEQYNYESVIDSIPNQGVTEYSDTKGIVPDQQYHYYVKVIGDKFAVLSTTDKWGDVGRWANLTPVQIVISTVEPDGRSVNLQWEQSTTNEFYEYAVFRTQQPEDLKKLGNVRNLDNVNGLPGRIATFQRKPDATAFLDKDLKSNETYYYFVAVVSTDQQVRISLPVTVKMPPPLPEQLNPVLKSSHDSAAIDLAWSGYRGPDFERYWLVRMYSPSGSQPTRTDTFAISGVDTVYHDLNVFAGNYSYQIGVRTADHGVVVSNWSAVAIRPKQVGANVLRIWITGETVKSQKGTEYSIHPFFMNNYTDDVYASGVILQCEVPGNPVFPFVVVQWRGHDDPHAKSLAEWLKNFNIDEVDEAKLRAIVNALTVAVNAESHPGNDAQFQDSLVRGTMKMSVRDTTAKEVSGNVVLQDLPAVLAYVNGELQNGYPRMMALQLGNEKQRFILAAGGAAILGLMFIGAVGFGFLTRKKLAGMKPTGPETLSEYMKRAKDAAFMDKLGRQLANVSGTMTVTEALKQLVAKLEGGASAGAPGQEKAHESGHVHGKGHEIPPALIQALIHLHQAVEHNFAHYGNYERFSAHQAENVITDYIKIAKSVLTLPIEGEKFGHAPSPHDIEKKLADGSTVLMHVFEEIQHERGVLRKVREEINIHDPKDVHDKVIILKRATTTLAAIQAMLERGNLIPHQPVAAAGRSSEEERKLEELMLKKLEEVVREKGAVDQKLAVAFPTDDERTRLMGLIDQALRIQHQLHIKTIAQIAAEVEGVSKYAESYMELAQEIKRVNPAVAVGDPHEVRAEFKKQLGR